MSKNVLIAILAVVILLTAGIGVVLLADNGSSGDSHEEYMRSLDIHKLGDYTYSIYYHDYDYEKGEEWFKKDHNNFGEGFCTGIYKEGILGRNYDWIYSNEPSLIVRTAAVNDSNGVVRHATLGVIASHILSDEQVNRQEYNEKFEYLPFYTVDGMNDVGLVCQMNVVPTGDHGLTDQKDPKKEDLYAMMSVRYILDYADTVDKAIELLSERNFKMTTDHEIHLLIAKGNRSVVVEYIQNELVVVENQYIMTNFYLNDVKDIDYGNGEKWSDEWYGQEGLWSEEWYNALTPYAAGMNRYNIVKHSYDGIKDTDTMHDVLSSIYYHKTYDRKQNPFWYDEFIGHGEFEGQPYSFDKFTSAGNVSFNLGIDIAIEQWEQRQKLRTNGDSLDVWQTIHSSIYDTNKHTLTVYTQTGDNPDGRPYTFRMMSANEDTVHVSITAVHGTVEKSSLDVKKGTTLTIEGNKLTFSDGQVITTQPEKDGYKLTKWTDDKGNELKDGTEIRISDDTQLMAHWESTAKKTANIVFLIGAAIATVVAIALIGAIIYGYNHPIFYILATATVVAAVFLYLVFFKIIKV